MLDEKSSPTLGLYEWLHEEIENENKEYRNADQG